MTTCKQCNTELVIEVLPELRADELIGLPNVTILGEAQQLRCSNTACGQIVGVSIPDAAGLQVALAVQRIMIPVRLSGGEIRFLRNTLGVKAMELAQMLEVTPATVSRWENEHKPMAPELEKLLRISAGIILSEHAPAVAFDPEAIIRMTPTNAAEGERVAFFCRRLPVLLRRCEHRTEEQTGWRSERTELPRAA